MSLIDYNKILEASLNEIYIFSVKTLKFIEANHGARENLGFSMKELEHLTPLDIKPDYTEDQFMVLIAPLLSGDKEKIFFETVHRRKNGTLYPVEVHLHISRVEQERVFVAIILDITERKQTEAELLKLSLQKERAQIVHDFIHDSSHEFRNRLAILLLKSDLISKEPLTERQYAHLEVITDQVHQIEKLINNLYELSELEATDRIARQRLSIPDLTRKLIEYLKLECESAQNSQILLEIDPTLPEILADYHLLRNALYRILKNACDFNQPDGKVFVHAFREASNIYIMVEDTGIGISPEDLPHIFNPLYRSDKARSLNGSYGIGLSIARRIINLHGGDIQIESTPGRGTTVITSLPIIEEYTTLSV